MVDATIHFWGQGVDHRSFPALPRVGDLLDAQGLWRVAAVVLSAAAVDVYVVRAADSVTAELATWGDAPTEPEPAGAQRGQF